MYKYRVRYSKHRGYCAPSNGTTHFRIPQHLFLSPSRARFLDIMMNLFKVETTDPPRALDALAAQREAE